MFTWLNKQGVKSSDGFEVQSIDRFTIEYKENSRTITIDVEHGESGGRPCVIIRSDVFEHWDVSGTRNSPKEQARLLANFKAAMLFQGIIVE